MKRGLLLSVLGATFGFMFSEQGQAHTTRHASHIHPAAATATHGHAIHHAALRRGHGHERGHVIQCVAFAKSASDVEIRGNAVDWWYNAAGRYARGSAPEEGSVLNFRGTRRMPLGHVAVVRQLVNSRTIIIDQSHWGQGGISRAVPVIDVSPNNDWSAVRVALNNHSGGFGSIYPTYGFIYARPAAGSDVMLTTYQKAMHSNPTVMAQAQPRTRHNSTEVAEAPEGIAAGRATSSLAYTDDVPNRSLR
ncbi:CHAP domain-containing protein [Komagataeibacter rhaeticus]|uniref:CHAP domain-containing protein n=1 Tax=Komagataeibacter rhaeticus TaxID=215221 RepID=A0A858JLX5_9PROT|nr:CHAP domain-containing protein [Komagataeibacter rhaeticus]MBL7239882.1 CHAP domain-containing protein [Komagataeibacter rhaeticus]QIP34403.1 CHAP domain-containing protein [Komagataeibacter rhaeticus]QOC46917.1 CHAP domain-containing protein [Komagataeibacter rhaeticus]WPP20684.1 CHAP domain-containing protein [Komagataeibacter rhaeticus]